MQKGYLVIHVYLEDISHPVAEAAVTIKGNNYERTFITDVNGKIKEVELDAPNIEYSLTPQHEIKPYALYEISASKQGLNTSIVKNVEILPGETSIQNIFMKNATGEIDIDVLDDHCLWEACEKIPEASIKPEAELNNPQIYNNLTKYAALIEPNSLTSTYSIANEANLSRVLPRVIVPEYIIVHDGAPSAAATNYTVTFIDYIKNVASSEIYSTWHVEALKANIHAIVSFTLNRIFTEWYRSRGYAWTITSSPAYDQKYTHNRTIFQSISNVVDQYFRYYIRLSGVTQPLLAQYAAGPNNVPAGRLSQWGSQSLATSGKSALEILRHYYTNSLSLVVGEEMIGLPSSFPGYSLNLNSCGEYVQKLQTELNRIRTAYPALPAISPADGKFGQSTKAAVEAFQKLFDLPVTGIVDFATWYKVSYYFNAIAGLSAGV